MIKLRKKHGVRNRTEFVWVNEKLIESIEVYEGDGSTLITMHSGHKHFVFQTLDQIIEFIGGGADATT